MGISEWVLNELKNQGFITRPVPDEKWQKVNAPKLGRLQLRTYQDEKQIDLDSRCGEVVCFCEKVTRADIDRAMESDVPARDLDGLRRRTRCTQGRCQGFYCYARVSEILAQKWGPA